MGKMKETGILKWPLNNNKNSTKGKKEDKKKWIHSTDTLTSGHVAYLVKFLGSTEVDKPKGIEVVKDGIRKLKFNQQLKKAEGTKTPKVELTISIDGVAIQEPKTKAIQHQYPLHRISYCADDKAEKRFFSFIAKEESDKHTCFVFVSDKLAEEITLTIGQAFDLAYQRYINGQPQDGVNSLEHVNSVLKDRLKELAGLLSNSQLNDFLNKHNISEVCEVKMAANFDSSSQQQDENNAASGAAANANGDNNNGNKAAATGGGSDTQQLIILDDQAAADLTVDDINDSDFDPRAGDSDSGSSGSGDDFNSRFNNININSVAAVAALQQQQQQQYNTPQHMVGITPPPAFPPPSFGGVASAAAAAPGAGIPPPAKKIFPLAGNGATATPPPALPPRESKNPFAAMASPAGGFGGQDPFGMSTFNSSEQQAPDIFADLDPLNK